MNKYKINDKKIRTIVNPKNMEYTTLKELKNIFTRKGIDILIQLNYIEVYERRN